MANTYITALTESLEKKVDVLTQIKRKNEEQSSIIESPDFSFDKFDINTEEKGVLIYKLEKLDDGFEMVYEKVREELAGNKEAYRDEIKRMQDLITKITELSTCIQAQEQRNKTAVESVFKSERDRIKATRSGAKALKSYSDSMTIGKNLKNFF